MAATPYASSLAAPTAAQEVTCQPFVEVRQLVKRYRSGVVANDGISLNAHLGEILAVLGPNGAGKTTLVLQLLGLLRPTSGTIRVGGIDVVARPAEIKRIANYQPQGHMAMGGVEVRHTLTYTGCLRGLTRSEADAQAAALMAEFGLGPVRNTPLSRLSGGWRRLVDVAVAFMGRPGLIVLDEPTNDLDPVHRQLVWDKLNALRGSHEVTCFLVTHNLLEAERVVDRVAIINRGRLVASGTPGELKQQLASDLRLDVYLRVHGGSGAAPPALAELGCPRLLRPGHLRFFLASGSVPRAMSVLLAEESRALIDDFRLAPPSLEDVYLQLEENIRASEPA